MKLSFRLETMKTQNVYIKYFTDFWFFIRRGAKAIISGIPSQKVYSGPNRMSKVHMGDEKIKPDFEKHYHRPHAKPVVEKQTLRKESKKVKVHYK